MASAAAVGMIGGSSSCCWTQFKNHQSQSKKTGNDRRRSVRVCCVSSSSSSSWVNTADPYRTLQIQPGASESEVRKAFRQLALQYHPDVCRGNNCGVQFHQINEAYDFVMSSLRGESTITEVQEPYYDQGIDEPMRGMNDPDWDMWEEWMGWEGAGIRDYTSHINPYI